MRIINPGIEIPTEKIVTCKRCNCKFAYTKEDVKHDDDGPYHSSYVICPHCHEFINDTYSELHRF